MIATRPASVADAGQVAALTEAAYAQYVPVLGRKPRPMTDDHLARLARGETFVVEEGPAVVGLISLEPGPEAVHIYSIVVAEEFRGRGLLRVLLGIAEERARATGVPKLTLLTNVLMTRNRAVYAHLGFRETSIEPGMGYRLVHMERMLPQWSRQ